jgi:hypothetical protein
MPISGYKMNAVLVQDVSLEQGKYFCRLAEDNLGYQAGINKFNDTTNCYAYLFDDIENAEAFQSLIENPTCIISTHVGRDEWHVEMVQAMVTFIPELAA